MKDYFYMLIDGGLSKTTYITEPYLSLATGNICVTFSRLFRNPETDKRFILCTDINTEYLQKISMGLYDWRKWDRTTANHGFLKWPLFFILQIIPKIRRVSDDFNFSDLSIFVMSHQTGGLKRSRRSGEDQVVYIKTLVAGS
jgi:hypothetical protein